jgi:hypothetical protein
VNFCDYSFVPGKTYILNIYPTTHGPCSVTVCGEVENAEDQRGKKLIRQLCLNAWWWRLLHPDRRRPMHPCVIEM